MPLTIPDSRYVARHLFVQHLNSRGNLLPYLDIFNAYHGLDFDKPVNLLAVSFPLIKDKNINWYAEDTAWRRLYYKAIKWTHHNFQSSPG